MKKKVLAVLCIVLGVMCFAGCGTKVENEEKNIRGTWENNVFTNEYIDISFNLPEGWAFATDEEMNATLSSTSDVIEDGDKKFVEASEQKAINDMMAQNLYTGSNVIISLEDLSSTVGGSYLTADQYIDIVESQLKNVETFSYKLGQKNNEEISGNEYVTISASIDDLGITQKYYTRKVDNYMINIVVTSSNSDESIESIVSNFN